MIVIHLKLEGIPAPSFEYSVSKVSTFVWFENHNLYFLTLSITFIPVLLLSFDGKIHFYKKWKYLWKGILLVGTFFVLWDLAKTSLNVWSFNDKYIWGYFVVNLPVEECLFFVIIPYACVFVYECISGYFDVKMLRPVDLALFVSISISLLIVSISQFGKTYTFVASLIALAYLIYHFIYESLEVRGRFYVSFLLILIPFSLVDGILTGAFQSQPVVVYNPKEIIGLRFFSIPIEDLIYLFPLMMANVTCFDLQKNGRKQEVILLEDEEDMA